MRLLIQARNRAVAIEHGRIVEAAGPFDLVLAFGEAEVRPGLINAHDHLHRNHYGKLGRPPYPNAYRWAQDIQFRCRRRIAERRLTPRRDALLLGAWKNLFAGVTTVVHHDAWEPDFEAEFPVRVAPVRQADSLGMTGLADLAEGRGPFCLHLAEGIDPEAADEVRSVEALGLLTSDLIAVHGVGLDEAGVRRFRASGAALVWCPTSNLFLFGRTAPLALLAEGVDVLLGSDSRLTGAGDLLDELRCARLCGVLDEDRLQGAVGAVAARRLGLAAPSLEVGAVADLMVIAAPLLEASAADVALVLVGGAPRVARPDLAPRLRAVGAEGAEMQIGSVVRWTSNQAAPGREEMSLC